MHQEVTESFPINGKMTHTLHATETLKGLIKALALIGKLVHTGQ